MHGDPVRHDEYQPATANGSNGRPGPRRNDPTGESIDFPSGLRTASEESKLAATHLEVRALRADLALQEWKTDRTWERIAEQERTIAEQGRMIEELHQAVREVHASTGFRAIERLRQFHGRCCPPGTLRRRLAGHGMRGAKVLAREGPVSLLRRSAAAARRRLRFTVDRLRRTTPTTPAPVVDLPPSGLVRSYRFDPPGLVLAPPLMVADHGALRIAVASSSVGNCFFHQIRDLVAAGLAELGHQVLIENEHDGFRREVDWRVIIAPHEFFYIGTGDALRHEPWPDNVILVSTEQPSTPWFAMAWECLPRANAIWDIDFGTASHLRRRGLACDYLPLGFVPGHATFNRVQRIAEHYGSCHLSEEVRGTSAAAGPLHQRPLDIFFIGGNTPRREAFLARAAPTLADYRCYLHLFDGRAPLLQGKNTYMDAATVVGMSQRSRILLNIHRGDDIYFEWQRIVLQGIWQKTLVVTETCSLAPPFRAGVDFVEASIDHLPRTLRYYLSDPRGRREAQEIASSGHETLANECRLSRYLGTLMARHASAGAVLTAVAGSRADPST